MNNIYHSDIYKFEKPVNSYWEDTTNENFNLGKLTKDIKSEVAVIGGGYTGLLCAINLIAQAKKAVGGDLSKIKSCVKITGFVNSADDFVDQPKVLNAASELLSEIFGINGKHARAAVSTNSLPLGIAVEIDAIFEI